MPEPSAVLFDSRGSTEVVEATLPLSDIPDDQLLWIDRGPAGLAGLAQSLGVDRELLEQLDGVAERPALVATESALLVTVSLPAAEGRPAPFTQLRCLVGENWVITAHDADSPVVADFRDYAQGAGEVGRLDGLSFLATLLEWVFEAYREAFEAIEDELERFDVRALEGKFDDTDAEVRGLVNLRRTVGRLRRELVRQRPVVTALEHFELDPLSTPDTASRFAALAARLEETVQASRDCRDAVVASFDVIIARSEHRTNEIMKVLALVTVLFLPGSFLAGLMGVNFRLSFFSESAYFWVLVGTIAAAAVATLALARMRRWI